MTVSELIAILSRCEPSARVHILDTISGEYVTLDVEIDEVEGWDVAIVPMVDLD
jgi:hypothetical protein